jgi:c-di-GMP-binding flagellar brake protein YcgR
VAADTSFLIKNQKQIMHNLSLLIKQKCLFTVHFGEKNESFLTALLDIDNKNNQLIFDRGPKEYLNSMLLASAKSVFSSNYNGIKVSFSGSNITKTSYLNQPVLSLPLPESLKWLERRNYYRVKIPISSKARCSVPMDDNNLAEFKLFDISLSGFSFINESATLSDLLIPDTQFDDGHLLLPDIGEGKISFVIRHNILLNPSKPDTLQRIGCEFTAVAPAFESSIQRFMQSIELELRKKS